MAIIKGVIIIIIIIIIIITIITITARITTQMIKLYYVTSLDNHEAQELQ